VAIWMPEVFKPFPFQQASILAAEVVDILLLVGGRGSSKSTGALWSGTQMGLKHGAKFFGVVVRKDIEELKSLRNISQGWIDAGLPARHIGGQKEAGTVVGQNGYKLDFSHCDNSAQIEKWIGANMQFLLIDEGGHYEDIDRIIEKIKGSMRSASGIKPVVIVTANPGCIGWHHLKRLFCDRGPEMTIIEDTIDTTVMVRGKVRRVQGSVKMMWMHSTVFDNLAMMENNPGFAASLASIKDPTLRAAWLDGNIDVEVGKYFVNHFRRDRHVVLPFKPPDHWPIWRGYDWGSVQPFVCGWLTMSDGITEIYGRRFRRGAIIQILEMDGAAKDEKGSVNLTTGTGLSTRRQAELFKAQEKEWGLKVSYGYADTQIFATNQEEKRRYVSIADKFRDAGIIWFPAWKNRIEGWNLMKELFDNDLLFVCSNCKNTLDTINMLDHDPKRIEDVLKCSIDHWGDMLRYGVCSRIVPGHSRPENDKVWDEMWHLFADRIKPSRYQDSVYG